MICGDSDLCKAQKYYTKRQSTLEKPTILITAAKIKIEKTPINQIVQENNAKHDILYFCRKAMTQQYL